MVLPKVALETAGSSPELPPSLSTQRESSVSSSTRVSAHPEYSSSICTTRATERPSTSMIDSESPIVEDHSPPNLQKMEDGGFLCWRKPTLNSM